MILNLCARRSDVVVEETDVEAAAQAHGPIDDELIEVGRRGVGPLHLDVEGAGLRIVSVDGDDARRVARRKRGVIGHMGSDRPRTAQPAAVDDDGVSRRRIERAVDRSGSGGLRVGPVRTQRGARADRYIAGVTQVGGRREGLAA